MRNQYTGEHIELLTKMATRKEGVSSSEFAIAAKKEIAWASRYIGNRVSRKMLLCAKFSHKICRYFTKQADADQWLASLKPAVSVPVRIATATPPAHQEGEPIIPKGVKIQRCPNYQPRNQVVELLTNKPPITRRSGEEFLSIKSRGF